MATKTAGPSDKQSELALMAPRRLAGPSTSAAPTPEEIVATKVSQFGRSRQFPEPCLRCQFKSCNSTDDAFLVPALYHRAGASGQARIIGHPPDQYMGVEKKAQSPPSQSFSSSSGSGSKKNESGIFPRRCFIAPGARGFCDGRATGPSFATGLSPREMIISSPFSARAISFDNSVLAL